MIFETVQVAYLPPTQMGRRLEPRFFSLGQKVWLHVGVKGRGGWLGN